jgi:hypothetical protein
VAAIGVYRAEHHQVLVSAGDGAKGKRWYAWSRTALSTAGAPVGWERWLLVRRNLTSGELAFYLCDRPGQPAPGRLVKAAGTRWRIEEALQATKGLCGLDQHQVRRWRSWYRWATLAMLAHAFLVVVALAERTRHPVPPELIPLTCNEVQHPRSLPSTCQHPDRQHSLISPCAWGRRRWP